MSKWVCAWGTPTSYVADDMRNILEDTTFRYVFYNPIKGEKIRLRFSNLFGRTKEEITEAAIAEWGGDGSKILPGTSVGVTFNSDGNVVAPGGEILSDAVDFTLEPGKKYAVSVYFKGVTRVVSGYTKYGGDVLALCRYTRGNRITDEDFPLECRKETFNYMFLCGVDAWTGDDTNAVMAFGDSITARPWPDYLARRINEEGITNRSVVRKAIGGNRVLRDYRNVLGRRHMGLSAIERVEQSLKQTPGVDKVVMLEGINDLCHPGTLFSPLSELPTADELIGGYKYVCDVCHRYGAKFYLATILPTVNMIKAADGREDVRLAVNEWIRTADCIDGYIEFEKALADPADPHVLAPEYDDDGLHPNDAGSRKLCATIPEHIFKN